MSGHGVDHGHDAGHGNDAVPDSAEVSANIHGITNKTRGSMFRFLNPMFYYRKGRDVLKKGMNWFVDWNWSGWGA